MVGKLPIGEYYLTIGQKKYVFLLSPQELILTGGSARHPLSLHHN